MTVVNTEKNDTLVSESVTLEIKKLENYEINDECIVKVTDMGNVTEVMYMERINHKATIQKIDKTHYLVVSTGEVFEVEETDSRAQSKNSLYQTFRRLRALINANVTNVNNTRWITLTYADNMTDTKRLYDDYRKFIQRMRYYCKENEIKPFEYIVCMEPQGRGSWHCHLLMIWKSKAPYIANNVLADIWNQGFVKIKKLDDIDNIGAYLTAYLGDMEVMEVLTSNRQIHGKAKIVETDGMQKCYVKGARLVMYPPGFNLYRASKGIEQPKEKYMTYAELKKASVGALTYKSAIAITDMDYSNTICKEYYNKKR